MKYQDYIKKQDASFYEMYEQLAALPSPRKQFLWWLVKITGCSPITVKMWLMCGQRPNHIARRAIALELDANEENLFPNDVRYTNESLAGRYRMLSTHNEITEKFLITVASASSVSIYCVKRWIRNHKVPQKWRRRHIAKALGISESILFPGE